MFGDSSYASWQLAYQTAGSRNESCRHHRLVTEMLLLIHLLQEGAGHRVLSLCKPLLLRWRFNS